MSKSSQIDPRHQELHKLDASIRRALTVPVIIAGTLLAVYGIWFRLLLEKDISELPDAWGQFGDYFGGVLNPLVALAALYWLTKSVRLQKEELIETRVALEESSRSQAVQARATQVSVKVSALTALISAIGVEIQSLRFELQFLVAQSIDRPGEEGRLLNGTVLESKELHAHIRQLDLEVSARFAAGRRYEEELQELLLARELAA